VFLCETPYLRCRATRHRGLDLLSEHFLYCRMVEDTLHATVGLCCHVHTAYTVRCFMRLTAAQVSGTSGGSSSSLSTVCLCFTCVTKDTDK
jgi:hypothetical protein